MIREQLLEAVRVAMAGLGVDPLPSAVVIERPSRREHGDWSTNAALVSAKVAGRNPRELGQALLEALDANPPPHLERLELAGPGFVNFHLAPSWLHDELRTIVDAQSVGSVDLGHGRSVNVEYVSANPTGPIHAGGGRWGAFGDSLARIMERCGYKVHREFYINDRGVQTQLFGASLEAAKVGEDPPEGGYLGAYITEWAEAMPADADPIEWGKNRSLQEAREVLASMHVEFDTWSSEAAIVVAGGMDEVLAALRNGGHVYDEDGATWLRTTTFGDDQDRVLIRSDGEPTYFLPDIAYHRDKYNRGDHLIDILGADHHGYVPRMRAALQALGHDPETYEAIIGQNVKLVRDGAEVKMSKRAGTIVEIGDLIGEVGPDVARFVYLLQSIDSPQTIDLDVFSVQASENPVFYVQYANARIHSIGQQAAERNIERLPIADVDLSVLTHEREIELLRELSSFVEVLELACNDRAPHRIATWVRGLAAAFHGFYRECPILRSDVDPDLRQARLWLAEAARIGLAAGLDLLGVDAPESM
ncbi:MAG: arginine--tRNA ligase [Acidimicrobiales bacterium]